MNVFFLRVCTHFTNKYIHCVMHFLPKILPFLLFMLTVEGQDFVSAENQYLKESLQSPSWATLIPVTANLRPTQTIVKMNSTPRTSIIKILPVSTSEGNLNEKDIDLAFKTTSAFDLLETDPWRDDSQSDKTKLPELSVAQTSGNLSLVSSTPAIESKTTKTHNNKSETRSTDLHLLNGSVQTSIFLTHHNRSVPFPIYTKSNKSWLSETKIHHLFRNPLKRIRQTVAESLSPEHKVSILFVLLAFVLAIV